MIVLIMAEKINKDHVLCPKCGMDIENAAGATTPASGTPLANGKPSAGVTKCPRCGVDLNAPVSGGKTIRIIHFGLINRAKKYFLHFALLLTCAALAYNITMFFTQVFVVHGWWLALLSLPFVVLSVFMTNYARLRSDNKMYRRLAWCVVILNVIAAATIIVTSLPQVNAELVSLYRVW